MEKAGLGPPFSSKRQNLLRFRRSKTRDFSMLKQAF